MSEKRYYIKKVIREERPKLFSSVGADYKYFIVERVKRSWGEYGGNFLFNFGVDYAFAEKVCNLLNEQQDTINNLQEVVAELGATLLMNGFEIEIDGKDLNELIKDE